MKKVLSELLIFQNSTLWRPLLMYNWKNNRFYWFYTVKFERKKWLVCKNQTRVSSKFIYFVLLTLSIRLCSNRSWLRTNENVDKNKVNVWNLIDLKALCENHLIPDGKCIFNMFSSRFRLNIHRLSYFIYIIVDELIN